MEVDLPMKVPHPRRGKHASLAWPILAGVLVILGCKSDEPTATAQVNAQATNILDVRIKWNGELRPGLSVRFEPFDTPRLDELRQQELLEAVVAGAADEFERILLLKDWVAAQWPHGSPNPYPPWDAIVILDWIRSGRTGGFCAQYAQVLLQSFASLGLTARYIELGSADNPYAHFVTEVWSNQYDKWVMMDADYNVHFERSGVPLSALEIHDALVHSELSEVNVISGAFREGHLDPQLWPNQTAELYYYVRLHLKADHLTMSAEPAFDRFNDMVDWIDASTVPWEDSTVPSPFIKERLTNVQISDRAAFESALNQVRVRIDSAQAGNVLLNLENNVFQFQRYQVRKSGRYGVIGDWIDHDGSVFSWKPSLTAQTLELRGVNTRGVPGPSSVVTVRFGPSDR